MRRFSLLPAWCLSLAAWGAPSGQPPGLPDADAIQQEMLRQKIRGSGAMRRADEIYRANPGRPVQSTPSLSNPVSMTAAGADPLAVAERYRQGQNATGEAGNGPDLLVFVSFSMPETSLRRLALDAARTGAVLVFRGPKEGSLKKTLQAFQPLAKLGAQAILHPEAFTRNRVDAVPVYVLGTAASESCEDTSGSCREALRLAGDASLEYILERMAQASHPLAMDAEARLNRLRDAR